MRKSDYTTRVQFVTFGPIHPTRFPDLRYQRQGDGNWRILELDGFAVGPQYPTRLELLSDLERFAEVYGAK